MRRKLVDPLMRKIIFVSIIALLTSAGCALNPERLSLLSDDQLCKDYGDLNNGIWNTIADVYKREIINRDLITDAEWVLVSEKTIQIGIDKCALYASWGTPYRENSTVGSWGVHVQHVYRVGSGYVYTENGRVTSWQN